MESGERPPSVAVLQGGAVGTWTAGPVAPCRETLRPALATAGPGDPQAGSGSVLISPLPFARDVMVAAAAATGRPSAALVLLERCMKEVLSSRLRTPRPKPTPLLELFRRGGRGPAAWGLVPPAVGAADLAVEEDRRFFSTSAKTSLGLNPSTVSPAFFRDAPRGRAGESLEDSLVLPLSESKLEPESCLTMRHALTQFRTPSKLE
mmetsp:Transcript_11640/g.32977  ORF Transcript_11640/g.32977 Transcript_11640/m.32977 type:complete len:206 (-) Transcript_11640:1175-1792(-)